MTQEILSESINRKVIFIKNFHVLRRGWLDLIALLRTTVQLILPSCYFVEIETTSAREFTSGDTTDKPIQ